MASQKVTEILAHVNEQETDLDNVLVILADLRAARAAGASPEELDGIMAELAQNKAKLASALSTNVPPGEPPGVTPNP